MPGISDNQSDILLLREVKAGNDIVDPRNIDGVDGIVTELARPRFGSKGVAGLVLEVWIHHLCRLEFAA